MVERIAQVRYKEWKGQEARPSSRKVQRKNKKQGSNVAVDAEVSRNKPVFLVTTLKEHSKTGMIEHGWLSPGLDSGTHRPWILKNTPDRL